MKRIWKAVEAAINSAKTIQTKNRLEDIAIHTSGYAEPGYSGEIIATGNWNVIGEAWSQSEARFIGGDNTPRRLMSVLEKLGVAIEWSDEWSYCDSCSKLVRTVGDSYAWRPSYAIFNESICCHECLKSNAKEYLEHLEGKYSHCCTIDVNPAEYNYVKAGEYQHGFYPGQTDDPKLIAKDLRSKGVYRFIFTLDRNGQFDQRFSVWIHEDEMEQP
jgi:hypothetical protein